MRRSLLALVLAVCTISAPASANYIRNGDFSQDDLYWTGYSLQSEFNQAFFLGNNRSDGGLEQSFSNGGGPLWVEYDITAPDGGYAYATWNGVLIPGSFYSGGTTHLLFQVTGTGQDVLAIQGRRSLEYIVVDNVAVNDVPEPASMALLAAGCLGLASRRRRR